MFNSPFVHNTLLRRLLNMETINEMYEAVHELLKRQENFSEDYRFYSIILESLTLICPIKIHIFVYYYIMYIKNQQKKIVCKLICYLC